MILLYISIIIMITISINISFKNLQLSINYHYNYFASGGPMNLITQLNENYLAFTITQKG